MSGAGHHQKSNILKAFSNLKEDDEEAMVLMTSLLDDSKLLRDNDIQEAFTMSALRILNKVTQNEETVHSPLARGLVIHFISLILTKCRPQNPNDLFYEYLTRCLKDNEDIVCFEAAKACTQLRGIENEKYNEPIKVLESFASSQKQGFQFVGLEALDKVPAALKLYSVTDKSRIRILEELIFIVRGSKHHEVGFLEAHLNGMRFSNSTMSFDILFINIKNAIFDSYKNMLHFQLDTAVEVNRKLTNFIQFIAQKVDRRHCEGPSIHIFVMRLMDLWQRAEYKHLGIEIELTRNEHRFIAVKYHGKKSNTFRFILTNTCLVHLEEEPVIIRLKDIGAIKLLGDEKRGCQMVLSNQEGNLIDEYNIPWNYMTMVRSWLDSSDLEYAEKTWAEIQEQSQNEENRIKRTRTE